MDRIAIETSRKDIADLMAAVSALAPDDFDVVHLQDDDEEVWQAGGLHEAVFLLLQDQSWIAIGGAAMGIAGAEVVKDLYKQTKARLGALFALFKPQMEQLGVDAYLRPRGTRVDPVWEHGPEGPVQKRTLWPLPAGVPDEGVHIRYSGRAGRRDPYVFDVGHFHAAFDTYENVVCPLIAYWRQQGTVRSVQVEGRFGPGEAQPQWDVLITTGPGTAPIAAEIAIRVPHAAPGADAAGDAAGPGMPHRGPADGAGP